MTESYGTAAAEEAASARLTITPGQKRMNSVEEASERKEHRTEYRFAFTSRLFFGPQPKGKRKWVAIQLREATEARTFRSTPPARSGAVVGGCGSFPGVG